VHFEAVAVVDEATAAAFGRCSDERRNEFVRVSLPLAGVGDRGRVNVRKVAVGRVVKTPPPKAVQDTYGLRV